MENLVEKLAAHLQEMRYYERQLFKADESIAEWTEKAERLETSYAESFQKYEAALNELRVEKEA